MYRYSIYVVWFSLSGKENTKIWVYFVSDLKFIWHTFIVACKMPISKVHSKRTRNLAFKIWRREGKNLTKTSRVLDAEYRIKVEPPTIMKWRDKELWEAKSHLIENQVRRLMRSSDDPVLQEMALDDSMFMRFLGIMTRLIEDVIGKAQARKRFLPKNSAELMKMMEFVASHQERILGKQQREAGDRDKNGGNITINDNRRIVLQGKLQALPTGQRQKVISEIHGAIPDQKAKALARVRAQVWDEDETESPAS